VAASLVRFRHRLLGHSDRWEHTRAIHRRVFRNLPAGPYRFEVAASLDGVTWSPIAMASLRLVAFHERAWFRALAAAVGAVTAALAFQWRRRLLHARAAATLKERRRLALDLHDALAVSFTGIGFQLDRLGQMLGPDAAPDVKQVLAETREMVRHSRLEARRSVWNVRAQTLDQGRLGEALADSLGEARRAGVAEVALEICGREAPLPDELAQALLRIAQEAVVNALAHGKAASVRVLLRFDDGRVALEVQDDGAGMSLAPSDGVVHFGLTGMRERTTALGGVFAVESEPGRGTRVTVTFPRARRVGVLRRWWPRLGGEA
jgi:signal transduction histidine kinase